MSVMTNMTRICDKCKNMIVLNAISYGECHFCGKQIVCPHIPTYYACSECSTIHNCCEQCGTKLKEKK